MDVAKLREAFNKPALSEQPPGGFQSIRPGWERKVYRTAGPTQQDCRIPALITRDEPMALDTIESKRDGRLVKDLTAEAEGALKQLLARGKLGDANAAAAFISLAANATASLEKLGETNPELVSPIAQRHARWPCLMSLNPKDIAWNKSRLKSLRAGHLTATPPTSKQRSNPHDYWTHLAGAALQACWEFREDARKFSEECKGAKRTQLTGTVWATPIAAVECLHPDGTLHLIPDWQCQSEALAWPINAGNVAAWWNVTKGCVVYYWAFQNSDAYKTALQNAGQNREKDYVQRNAAFKRLEQAFRTLVGIR